MSDAVMRVCPHCGAEIPARAAACPECGSDEQTGWSENTYLDGMDLGLEDDYEELKAKEFSGGVPRKKPVLQLIIAGLLLIAFLIMLLRSYFL